MNWKKIIAELQAWGTTQPQIAAACGCAQATISGLATGKSTEPRHSLGQSILALHKDRAKKSVGHTKPTQPTTKGQGA